MGTSLFKYIALFFILFFLLDANAFAFEVNKTAGGANIEWSTSHVPYYINPSGGPSNNLSAFQAAMQTWTDVITSYFTFDYSGTTTNTSCGTNDGANIVCYGPMGLNGILAQNAVWYYTGSGQIIDSDIKFNTSYPWATDGSPGAYDVQNVGAHELGHSLSLADLYNAADFEKTMYGYGSAGEIKKRTLDQDDKDGIIYLYCDITPPTGSITINSGASYTNSTSATLTLSCTDSGSGCAQMRFSNDNSTWSTAETYAVTKSWTLTSGDGTKTVYAKFKDNTGNWSSAYSDTIVLDTAAPTTTASPIGGTYTSSQSVTLTCNDGIGSGCGNIYYTTDGSTPTTSSPVYSSSINITVNTTLKFFAVDNALNQEEPPKTETYIISVVAPLFITTSSLPSGTVGTAYNVTLTATGGVPSYTWSITAGTLPSGLTLCTSDDNPAPACTGKSGGTITGTPTAAGTFDFIVQVMDTNSSTHTKNFSIVINSLPPVRILRSPPPHIPHSAIQAAYEDDACLEPGDHIIQIQASDFNENVLCNRDILVTLEGGYDSNFESNSAYTTINGTIIGLPTLTISNGTVTVENIIIQ